MTSIGDTGLDASDFWVDEVQGESPITAWDVFYVGGEIWPGIWKIECERQRKIEVVKPSAKTPGALNDPTLTDKGNEPATLKATGQIWEKDSWIFLNELMPGFAPSSNATVAPAWDIAHPVAYLLGVTSIIVTKVKINPPVDQILVVEIDMLEWFPATVVPAGAKPLYPNSKPVNAGDFAVKGANSADVDWLDRVP